MAILKLVVGLPLTMKVASAEVVQGQFRPDVKFVGPTGDTVFVGEEVATRQLARFALNPTTVVGKTLKFEKVEKPGGKKFTNIDVVAAQQNGNGDTAGGALPRPAGTAQPPAPANPPAPSVSAPSGHSDRLYTKIAAYYCEEIIPMLKKAGVSVTHEGTSAAIAAIYIAATNGKH